MARVRLRLQQVKKITDTQAPIAYTEMFGKTLVELAEQDADIVAITAAMPDGTGLNKICRMLSAAPFWT